MTLRTALQCDVCAAQLRAVIDRRGAPAPVVQLADLVLELAAAVDNAAEDIGGSRPQLTILREAVEIATALKGKR